MLLPPRHAPPGPPCLERTKPVHRVCGCNHRQHKVSPRHARRIHQMRVPLHQGDQRQRAGIKGTFQQFVVLAPWFVFGGLLFSGSRREVRIHTRASWRSTAVKPTRAPPAICRVQTSVCTRSAPAMLRDSPSPSLRQSLLLHKPRSLSLAARSHDGTSLLHCQMGPLPAPPGAPGVVESTNWRRG